MMTALFHAHDNIMVPIAITSTLLHAHDNIMVPIAITSSVFLIFLSLWSAPGTDSHKSLQAV